VRLRAGPQGGTGAVSGFRNLPRQPLHVHQMRCFREACHLRNERRQAEPHQFRSGQRHVHRPEGHGCRVSGDRQKESRLHATPAAIASGEPIPTKARTDMTEQSTAPAATPIQDKAPKPPGLMPKNIQAWVMLGLAVLMVAIMWLTGGKKAQTTPKSNVPTFQPPAQAVNEVQINALQSR